MSGAEHDDRAAVRLLAEEIARATLRPMTIMEVCGTHTMQIARYGLRALLPPQIRLVSGPGCPVCVTDSGLISAALAIAALGICCACRPATAVCSLCGIKGRMCAMYFLRLMRWS